jgi:carboxypeptidase PM20D1
MIATTIRQCFPGVAVVPGLMIAGSDSRYLPPVVDNIYHFCPMRMAPESIKTIHGVDERISEADYINMIRFWMQFMTNLGVEAEAEPIR